MVETKNSLFDLGSRLHIECHCATILSKAAPLFFWDELIVWSVQILQVLIGWLFPLIYIHWDEIKDNCRHPFGICTDSAVIPTRDWPMGKAIGWRFLVFGHQNVFVANCSASAYWTCCHTLEYHCCCFLLMRSHLSPAEQIVMLWICHRQHFQKNNLKVLCLNITFQMGRILCV